MKKMLSTVAALLCVLLLGACGGYRATPLPSPTPTPALQYGVNPMAAYTPLDGGIPAVVERVSPAVVGIAVTTTQKTEFGGQTVEGLGTGVFVDTRGYILTNNHVTGSATQIDVVLQDGSRVPGKTVWSDKAMDLAVVKAEGGPYPAAEMGTSQNLKVGDTVVAIGTPLTLNFQHTVTSGIVSALRRTLKVPTGDGLSFMEELIQTDAPINPGNSGGPLCDMSGRIVGINTLKVTEAEGIGFAIPIEVAKPIVQKVEAEGGYTTPYLGLYAIDAEIARYYGQTGITKGILLIESDPDGPAYAAGLRKGDLITHMDGQPVDTVLMMRQVIYSHKPGEAVRVRWERDSQTGEVDITLGKKPVE
jgi:S1-C subfamily serine protease